MRTLLWRFVATLIRVGASASAASKLATGPKLRLPSGGRAGLHGGPLRAPGGAVEVRAERQGASRGLDAERINDAGGLGELAQGERLGEAGQHQHHPREPRHSTGLYRLPDVAAPVTMISF
jgi:hypothetical protein